MIQHSEINGGSEPAILVRHVWSWMITRKSTISGLRPEVGGLIRRLCAF